MHITDIKINEIPLTLSPFVNAVITMLEEKRKKDTIK